MYKIYICMFIVMYETFWNTTFLDYFYAAFLCICAANVFEIDHLFKYPLLFLFFCKKKICIRTKIIFFHYLPNNSPCYEQTFFKVSQSVLICILIPYGHIFYHLRKQQNFITDNQAPIIESDIVNP